MTTGSSLVRASARSLVSTSNPSSLGSFRSSRTICGTIVDIASRVRSGAEEVVHRLDAVARHHDFVGDVVLAQRAQRERLVVGVIFDQQDHLVSIEFSP